MQVYQEVLDTDVQRDDSIVVRVMTIREGLKHDWIQPTERVGGVVDAHSDDRTGSIFKKGKIARRLFPSPVRTYRFTLEMPELGLNRPGRRCQPQMSDRGLFTCNGGIAIP